MQPGEHGRRHGEEQCIAYARPEQRTDRTVVGHGEPHVLPGAIDCSQWRYFFGKGLIQTVPIAHGRDGRWGYPRVQPELVEDASRRHLREEERQDGYADQDQKTMAKPPAKVSHGGMLSHIPTGT